MKLFFYGVLLEGLGDWPFLKGIGPARRAMTRGTLYALRASSGWFPAMVEGEAKVLGAIHDAGGVDIAAMDAFEGADYARIAFPVEVDGETLQAQAYRWTSPVPDDAVRIGHGDFARWLAETGRSPITG